MADITSPNVILFNNVSLRPISESLRAAYYTCKSAKTKWDSEIAPEISENAASDVVVDGRAEQGVSVLSKNDMLLTMTQVNNFIALVESAGVLNVIEKPCVRPIQVV